MSALTGPLLLITARMRRRPARWLLPALGIALAVAFAGGVAAEGVIAADQSSKAVLRGLSALDRTVRVTWQGPATVGVARRAKGLLSRVGLGPQTEVVLLDPVRLSGVVVRPAAIAPASRWFPASAADRLGPCTAGDCPVALAGGGSAPSTLSAAGVRLQVVATAPLQSPVPLAFAPEIDGQWPVLVTGDPAGLDAVPALDGVYRSSTWLATLAVSRLHSWQLAAVQRRLASAQASLASSEGQFTLTGPFSGLADARAQAAAAPRRLLLIGGATLAGLALFLLLAAGGLRRDQLAELERLRSAGARSGQLAAFVAGEAAWLSAVALLIGASGAVLAATVLAHLSHEPASGVLAHSVVTAPALLVLGCGWVVSACLLALGVLIRNARVVDVVTVGAVAALGAGLSTGGDGSRTWALLLAPLCCAAAGAVVFRVTGPALRLLERGARRGPVLGRLALVGLARAPSIPALAIAVVAVSVALGGFALAYRATLLRGAADQAAFEVPLDARITAGPSLATPLELAPLGRWRSLAAGAVLPVRRTLATYVDGSGSVTVPALGIPAAALPQLGGWRVSYSSTPRAELATRLRPPGQVRVAGPMLPSGARTLSVGVSSPTLGLQVTADLRDGSGIVRRLGLGQAQAQPGLLRARLPAGQWEVEAFELDEPSGLEITNGHQNAENPAAATQSSAAVTLGPLAALGADGAQLATYPLGAWRGAGAASARSAGGAETVARIRFETTGSPGIVRPQQPSDLRPVPVLTDPQTAASAGPGGRLELTVDELPVQARVVGVLRRFPTVPAAAGGFVIADQQLLSSALDAQLPGQGLPDELWVSTPHPESLRAAVQRAPLSQLEASFRADVERDLRTAPIAHDVTGTLLAAAALSAALAAVGLLVALGTLRDGRSERDLEEQGVGPRGRRTERRVRLAVSVAGGATAGLVIAALASRLAAGAVNAAGTAAQQQPPLVAITPGLQLIAWSLAVAAALGIAGLAATR